MVRVAASGRFAVKAVADVIGVTRSNLVERAGGRSRRRVGRPPAPADELVAEIEALLADLPIYGYRRVHAVLRRRALAEGRQPPNHKRVYRVMGKHGLLLERHAGGTERRHDGKIAVTVPDARWWPHLAAVGHARLPVALGGRSGRGGARFPGPVGLSVPGTTLAWTSSSPLCLGRVEDMRCRPRQGQGRRASSWQAARSPWAGAAPAPP